MSDMSHGQRHALQECVHFGPVQRAGAGATRQCLPPRTNNFVAEQVKAFPVAGQAKIPTMAMNDAGKVRLLVRKGLVPAGFAPLEHMVLGASKAVLGRNLTHNEETPP